MRSTKQIQTTALERKIPVGNYGLLGGLLLLCLFLRVWAGWKSWDSEGIIFQSPDAFYHMRRILMAILSPGELNAIDYFRGMTEQRPCIWPIYYDLFYGVIIQAITLGQANVFQAEWIAAAIPPVAATLTGFLLYGFCRSLGAVVAFSVLAIFSILPKLVSIAAFTEIDHHSFELLGFMAICYFFTQAVEKPSKRSIFYFSLWLVTLFLIWSGSTLYAGWFAFMGFIWSLRTPQVTRILHQGYLWAALGLFPLYVVGTGEFQLTIHYSYPSLFQPIFLLICAFFFQIMAQFQDTHRVPVIPTLLFLILTTLISGDGLRGLDFIFGAGGGFDFARIVAEMQPLYMLPISQIFLSLSILIILAPFLAIWVLSRAWKTNHLIGFLLGSNFLISLALTISSQRFLYQLSLWLGPLLIWGIWQWTARWHIQKSISILTVGLLVLNVAPQTWQVLNTAEIVPSHLLTTALWLKENTPYSGDWRMPHQRPLYRILAPWDLGHLLMYRTQRPVVSDNFGSYADIYPRFLLAQNEDGGQRVLAPFKTRYILFTSGMLFNPAPTLTLVDRKPISWMYQKMVSNQGKSHLIAYPSPKMSRSLFTRLYLQDGSHVPFNSSPALQHFRLIYESLNKIPIHIFPYHASDSPFFILFDENIPPGFQPGVSLPSQYKIFEQVSGATIMGKGISGQLVQATVLVKTNTGRHFTYQQEATVSARGVFTLVVPYGKRQEDNHTQAISDYTITIGTQSTNISVSDQQVWSGATLIL